MTIESIGFSRDSLMLFFSPFQYRAFDARAKLLVHHKVTVTKFDCRVNDHWSWEYSHLSQMLVRKFNFIHRQAMTFKNL